MNELDFWQRHWHLSKLVKGVSFASHAHTCSSCYHRCHANTMHTMCCPMTGRPWRNVPCFMWRSRHPNDAEPTLTMTNARASQILLLPARNLHTYTCIHTYATYTHAPCSYCTYHTHAPEDTEGLSSGLEIPELLRIETSE